ncbi:hypothetical protein, variant [Phytophthora nicotianae CJ01A1]|uniref:Uncharacterized protein n=3 Tax=Phytophthora nicotianae TaxID=4792 RepID=V9G0T1_PHYNI|nr:hypothetical protein, variant [Phytophthora nicotianae P1569]ETK96707.1 hypothetical protein, variant [Phytophthora nicotianae]ETP26699.1 hypothetical protein, variant [Phytophthora nicotianae CJ01A1]ETL50053.1 hypothetical protein, variant [Phytophthora nicotianae]ETM03114.1 hypothetical protein, variant [Phytophthora nicotianae]
MSSAVGVTVLTRVALEVKQSETRQFTDAHGEMLASLPPDDMRLVQVASELVARNLVVKVTATPSMRTFYRVESLNKYKRRGDQDVDMSVDSVTQPFDDSMCKHMVARLLADATGQFQTMQVEDVHFAQMLCPPLSVDKDE